MEWIKVENQLPEHGQRVLIFQSFPKGTSFQTLAWPLIGCPWNVAEYGTYGKGFIGEKMNNLDYVTHWMPLPNPPNEIDEMLQKDYDNMVNSMWRPNPPKE